MRAALSSLCGIDKNLTACRIACFSLYIAYLDQFDPPGLRSYMRATGEKLPSLLCFQDPDKNTPDIAVVFEGDFFDLSKKWTNQFDLVIGNPPWAGRGSKQIAHKFMTLSPDLLTEEGRGCLLLPSKVFLNQTQTFQAAWLRRVTLEKVIQLADYSFILFKEALCPCVVTRFANRNPNIEEQDVEYLTPKVFSHRSARRRYSDITARLQANSITIPLGRRRSKFYRYSMEIAFVGNATRSKISGLPVYPPKAWRPC